MNTRGFAAASLLALGLAGCSSMQSQPALVGTWEGRGGGAQAPFSFGSVSFVGDNTFTAEARYGGNVRVQSGTWNTTDGHLMLKSGDTTREYTYKVEGSELAVTDPKSGHTITLDRMKK